MQLGSNTKNVINHQTFHVGEEISLLKVII